MKNVIVRLTEAERTIARFIARRRYEQARVNGVINRRVGGQSDAVTDFYGMLGEIAVAKQLNRYPDLSTELVSARRGTDHGDGCTQAGIAYDVKTTKYPNGRLMVTPAKRGTEIRAFVLVTGTGKRNRVCIRGCVSAQKLFREENYSRRFGCYVVCQSELDSLSRLR